jgi:N-acetylglutamate synthase-like GNAT family acetyltransferase
MQSSKTSEHPADPILDDPFLVRRFHTQDHADVLRLNKDGMIHGAGTECVDCGRLERIEESYFSRPQDHFWVAEANGKVIGTVAIYEVESQIVCLHWLRVDRQWWPDKRVVVRLVETAAKHAREHDCLKLIIQTSVDAARAIEFFEHRGFEFNRARLVDGHPRLEFYRHLYDMTEQPQE